MFRGIEPENRLYVKHTFYRGIDIAMRRYLTKEEREDLNKRGENCAICGHPFEECVRRQPFRSNAMGTLDYSDSPSRLVPPGEEHIIRNEEGRYGS